LSGVGSAGAEISLTMLLRSRPKTEKAYSKVSCCLQSKERCCNIWKKEKSDAPAGDGTDTVLEPTVEQKRLEKQQIVVGNAK
jgi:hypothetical protein